MRKKFAKISPAVPWQSYQIYRASLVTHHHKFEDPNNKLEIELIKGAKISYWHTDFGKLESLLTNTQAEEH